MDHEVSREAVFTRTRTIRDSAETDAEQKTRWLDTVDLVVGGVSARQIADHHRCSMNQVREDYKAGLALLIDRSVDYSLALRDEITMRQRLLILANLPRAKAGDRGAAQIVQGADALLANIWGLRSLRIEPPHRPRDDALSDAVSAYLDGITAAST